jgi:pilus assembly protein CpaF
VESRLNVVLSGGTGAGKTTLLNIASAYIPRAERIVTIEDAAELLLDQPHVVRLESRPPNIEGTGSVPIRELVRNALRMRPDRIIVGECRAGEALDMLQAMNTGHDGSLTTIHANSPRDTLSRIETMVLMAGFDLPVRAIREQIASAIDVVIQVARLRDGSRRIVSLCEVVGMEGDVVTMQEIGRFRQRGIDTRGVVLGSFETTGVQPSCLRRFEEMGIDFDVGTLGQRATEAAVWALR